MTPEEIVQALAEPYPACELEFKTEPYPAVYIDARTPMARLNRVLPLQWSFRLAGEARRDERGNVSRDGVLVLHLAGGDREFYATGTESADLQKGEPKAEKGADSDCFKRACFRAGIGCYIYELPKNLKAGSLTEAQVEQAARLAGYTGAIRPEHYGPMRKERVTQSFPSEAGGEGGDAPAAVSRPSAASTEGQAVGALASQQKYFAQWAKKLGLTNKPAMLEHLGGLGIDQWPETVEQFVAANKAIKLAHAKAVSEEEAARRARQPGVLADETPPVAMTDESRGAIRAIRG